MENEGDFVNPLDVLNKGDQASPFENALALKRDEIMRGLTHALKRGSSVEDQSWRILNLATFDAVTNQFYEDTRSDERPHVTRQDFLDWMTKRVGTNLFEQVPPQTEIAVTLLTKTDQARQQILETVQSEFGQETTLPELPAQEKVWQELMQKVTRTG